MSTYLLLRNNKESGPFTMDDLKRMSLKAYDLVWVEGKSAAWRYPGEIAELAAFAPQAPEQPYDRFYKKPAAAIEANGARNQEREAEKGLGEMFAPQGANQREELHRNGNAKQNRENNRELVYINKPASEKKNSGLLPAAPSQKLIELSWEEPLRFSDTMTNASDKPKKSSGRGLLITSVVLLFLAGMCTGFFISNRRNFYSGSGSANIPPSNGVPVMSKDFPQSGPEQSLGLAGSDSARNAAEQSKAAIPESVVHNTSKTKKKTVPVMTDKKDSVTLTTSMPSATAVADSLARLKQEAENHKAEQLTKLKAHPQDYLPVTAGKFRTGVLGGLSEFPVTLTNDCGVAVDLVVVTIDYILHNKKVFKTETVSFQNLAAGMTATAEAPKSSRGVSISYRVTTVNAQSIGLSYTGQ